MSLPKKTTTIKPVLISIASLLVLASSMTRGYGTITYDSSSVHVRQHARAEGGFNYTLFVRFFPNFFSPKPQSASYITADGVQIEASPFDYGIYFPELTLAELQSKATGTWTFIEERAASDVFHYEFTLPEVSLESFPEIPVITNPSEGAVVTSPFTVDWYYPSGDQPTGYRASRQFGPDSDSDMDYIEPGSATVSFELPEGVDERPVWLQIGHPSGARLPFGVTPIISGADSIFESPRLWFNSFSAPLNLIARVPEPSTLMLGAIASLACIVNIRCSMLRRSQNGRLPTKCRWQGR